MYIKHGNSISNETLNYLVGMGMYDMFREKKIIINE